MALTNKLSAIGNAIRSKTGGTELLTLDQMPEAITSIGNKTLTKLGEYSIEEPVQVFNITLTEEMKKSDCIIVKIISLTTSADDWIYPRLNNSTFNAYTPKKSSFSGCISYGWVPTINDNKLLVRIFDNVDGSTFFSSNFSQYKVSSITSVGFNTYTTSISLTSGTFEIWGYV